MMFIPLHAEFGFDPAVLSDIQDPEQTGEKSTVPALEQLATLSLLGLGVGGGDGLGTQVAVISALAQRSLSVAFSVWSHRMVIEYVTVSAVRRITRPRLDRSRTHRRPGTNLRSFLRTSRVANGPNPSTVATDKAHLKLSTPRMRQLS